MYSVTKYSCNIYSIHKADVKYISIRASLVYITHNIKLVHTYTRIIHSTLTYREHFHFLNQSQFIIVITLRG